MCECNESEKVLLENFPSHVDVVGWLVGFYDISTFAGYLTPNPFLCE